MKLIIMCVVLMFAFANATYDCNPPALGRSQRDWCCSNKGLLCDQPRPVSNCNFQYLRPIEWHLRGIREWCCTNKQIGCFTHSFNCETQEDASDAKKAWCCNEKKIGCAKRDVYSCDVGRPEVWGEQRRNWCCKHKQVCFKPKAKPEPSNSDNKYNCNDNTQVFSDTKKDWCCKEKKIGCAPTPHPEPFNCNDNTQAFSDAKKAWCCKEKKIGCAPNPVRCVCNLIHQPVCTFFRGKSVTFTNECLAKCANAEILFHSTC